MSDLIDDVFSLPEAPMAMPKQIIEPEKGLSHLIQALIGLLPASVLAAMARLG